MSLIIKNSLLLLLVCGVAAAPVHAAAANTPDKIIETLTAQMLAAIETARPTFAKAPEPFYARIEELVLPHMDIRNFARGVMGRYGSGAYYRSLKTPEEKAAFKARVLKFAEIFKHSVVRTYGKGLMTFDGQTITLVPLSKEQQSRISAGAPLEILQTIASPGSDPHELRYSFARNKKGQWLVRNILVDGINLGKVYQSQFAAAVKDHNGDVDAAIANWVVEPPGGKG